MGTERFDVIVIGGGPNGLTCAAYLARAGMRVVVLEKRFEHGGTMFSDDYSTPFVYNIGQFLLPLGRELPPYADLGLESLGIRFIEPDPVIAFVPRSGGAPLIVGRGGSGLAGDLPAALDAVSRAVFPLLYTPPVSNEEAERALSATEEGKRAIEFARRTPRDLAQATQDTRAAALLRYLCGVVGSFDGAEPLGLLRAFALARLLRPVIVRGGTKSLAIGLYQAGGHAGAQYIPVADVQHIERSDGELRATCRDGREFAAPTVVSALDPKATFLTLLEERDTPGAIRQRAEGWRLDPAGSFIAHFGIKGEAPRISTDEATRALSQVIGFEDETSVVEHLEAVARGQTPATPAGILSVTTRHDATLAAPGPYGPLHTLRFETLAAPTPAQGAWTRQRTADYRAECWKLIGQHTTGLDQARLLAAFSDSPLDIERRFRTTRNGSLRQGALTVDQILTNRPHADYSTTRTPISGLYLAGGGVHPGLPGSLAGGYNAARTLCRDLGVTPWWTEPREVQRAREQVGAGAGT